jgi:hypothetical protein
MRKRKRLKVKKPVKVRPYSNQAWLEFLSQEIQYLRAEVHAMRQQVSILVEKQERQHAQAMGIYMENARLRGQAAEVPK